MAKRLGSNGTGRSRLSHWSRDIRLVPLIDASGSTIALVNAASTQSAPATTYTYDPAGTPSVSGAANDWPFLYQGGEKEFTDRGHSTIAAAASPFSKPNPLERERQWLT